MRSAVSDITPSKKIVAASARSGLSALDVAELMARNGVGSVVVEQDGSLASVLSTTDIAIKLARILTEDCNRFGHLKALLDQDGSVISQEGASNPQWARLQVRSRRLN